MAAIAQGQFTITDYNDAITLSGYLASSVSKTQRYLTDSDSYLPDWSQASNSPIITPVLYRAGSSADLFSSADTVKRIKSIKWFINDVEVTTPGTNYQFETKTGGYNSATLNYQLKIKKNIMSKDSSGLNIRCDIVYNDSASGLDITSSLTLDFSLVRDGGGIVAIEVLTPEGEVFKNNTVQSLPIVSKLWRGSTVDTSNVSYKWAYNDSTVTSSTSPGYDATFGIGWHLISNGDNFTISNNELTVRANAVPSMLTIQCAAIDTEAKPNVTYIDGVTLVDRSDPIEVIITSTGGNVFKNGTGTNIELVAKVYQGGSEVDSNSCSYVWTQYNQHGVQVSGTKTVTGETTQKVTISPDMIESKATFWCQVTYPKASS